MLKNRDAKTKQALIDYLNKDTDERFWQAINNFGEQHGLCARYLTTCWHVIEAHRSGVSDLFYQESDELFGKNNDRS